MRHVFPFLPLVQMVTGHVAEDSVAATFAGMGGELPYRVLKPMTMAPGSSYPLPLNSGVNDVRHQERADKSSPFAGNRLWVPIIPSSIWDSTTRTTRIRRQRICGLP